MTHSNVKALFLGLAFLCLNFPVSAQETSAQTHNDFFDVLYHVYETHPALNAAREQLEETKELHPQATAGWKPTIQGEASIYATDIDNSNFGAGDGATTKDLSLTLDQPLWQGGQTFEKVKEAKDLINAGEALLHEAEQNVLLETLQSMLALARDRELYNLRVQNENTLLEERRAAQKRFDSGVLTLTDVEQAKSRLTRAKASTVSAARALDISRAEFIETTGLTGEYTFKLPTIDFQYPATIDDILAAAEDTNPTLWINRYEQSAAGHNAIAAFRELLPQISAFASYNKQYDPQPGIIPDSRTETIGLRAVIPLYQAGLKRSKIREAEHKAKRLEYQSEDAVRRIRQDVIRNYRSFLSAKEELQLREEEIIASQNALIGVREETNLGQRTVLDILDADRDVISARVALVTARYNEALANYSLAANLGYLNAANLGLVKKETP